ncbi:MAG: glycosyltransferase family 4 protein [Candidatus Bathyarchaeia archaeon]
MSMKIIIFSELLYPHGGGAELATWLYAKLLAEKGFDLSIVTSKFPNEKSFEIINERIRVYRFPHKVLLGTRYYGIANIGILMGNLITKLIKRSDVVYIPGGWYSAILLAKTFRKPVVLHLHNYFLVCPLSLMYDLVKQKVDSSSLRSFMIHECFEKKRNVTSVIVSSFVHEFFGRYYSRLGRMADALIFVSKVQRDIVLSKIPKLRDRSYVIYNPLPDVPLIEAERKGIGYFGGKRFVKGFHVLMCSLKMLKTNCEVYLANTSEKPKKLNMPNGVLVNLLPKLDKKSIENHLKKISIVAVPSLCPEPLPYTLVESMLSGKLVVASNIGGIPEVVDRNTNGVKLVKPGDCTEIAEALDYYLSLNLEEANEIGVKNREFILKRINNEAIIKEFTRVLDFVVNSI